MFVINSELPKHAPYLVIGAGTAAFAAYRAIRAADGKAQVCIDFTPCYLVYDIWLTVSCHGLHVMLKLKSEQEIWANARETLESL